MNFRELDELIHSGVKEIVLDSDIVLDDAEEFEYEDGIRLDLDDLVIDGNGHTIDARRKVQIFNVLGKTIGLKNIIFKNGFAKDSGGALSNSWRCELTVSNSAFIENTAKRYGGAIFNVGKLTVFDSTFTKNEVEENGGAIASRGGTITVSDSTFTENTAQERYGGGAIYNENSTLTVLNSTFTSNEALKDGGAIYNSEAALTVSNSIFAENTAKSDGGAIHNSIGSELAVSDSTFTKNKAQGKFCGGGAIYNKEATLAISDSTLIENRADYGGAIYNKEATSTVYDSNFTANRAKSYGGAIYNYIGSMLTIIGSTLKENNALLLGGAINNSGTSTVRESILTGNTAQKSISDRIELTLEKLIYKGNLTIKPSGGAICSGGDLTVSDSTLTENKAQDGGGAIYLSKYLEKYESENCTFKDNNPDDVYEEED